MYPLLISEAEREQVGVQPRIADRHRRLSPSLSIILVMLVAALLARETVVPRAMRRASLHLTAERCVVLRRVHAALSIPLSVDGASMCRVMSHQDPAEITARSSLRGDASPQSNSAGKAH